MSEQRQFFVVVAPVLLLVGSAVGLGCADPGISADGLTPPVDVAATRAEVVGGMSVTACQWPSTVSVNGWGSCTGTLIHPRIVTTAAHCLQGNKGTIYFGGGKNQPGSFSLAATKCVAGAQGSRGVNTSKDWGYCVLPDDERVKQIPVTPPLVGCEADKLLKAGMNASVVGFGTTGTQGAGDGVKRAVGVMINALNKVAPGTIDVGDAQQGACHGDSGGPLYVHLMDGAHDYGYRVVGSTSGAGSSFCDCSCSTEYINISNHVAAIEANEMIDVTPCTDAKGAFDPSPACAALVTSLPEGMGTFPGCMVAHTTEPISTCGIAGPSAGSGAGGGAPAAGSGGSAGNRVASAGMSGGGAAGVAGVAASAGTAGSAGALTPPSMPMSGVLVAAGSGDSAGRAAQATASAGRGSAGIGSSAFGVTAQAGTTATSEPPPPAAKSCSCSAPGAGSREGRAYGWFAMLGFAGGFVLRVRRRIRSR